MSMSRAEFMAQMGLTDDDVIAPEQESKRTTTRVPKKDSSLNFSRSSLDDSRFSQVDSVPSPPKRTSHLSQTDVNTSAAAPPRASKAAEPAAHSARSDFLKSLGIDNMDVPPTGASAPRAREPPQYDATSKPFDATPARNVSFSRESRPSPRTQEFNNAPAYHGGSSDQFADLGRKASGSRGSFTTPQRSASFDLGTSELPPDASAADIKNLGNKYFESGDFRKAVRLYTKAIEKDPNSAALYSNRSAAYLQGAKQMGIDTGKMSLRDAEKCIELRPTWFKGFARKGDALFKLERYMEALEAYKTGLQHDSSNANLLDSIAECRSHIGSSGISQRPSAGLSSGKTAHELLNEFHSKEAQALERGNDYKEEQLRRFKDEAAMNASNSSRVSFRSSVNEADTKPKLQRDAIPHEYSQQAAQDYRANLMASFRKKKE